MGMNYGFVVIVEQWWRHFNCDYVGFGDTEWSMKVTNKDLWRHDSFVYIAGLLFFLWTFHVYFFNIFL